MRTATNVAAIFRREMAAYFLSPIAYVVICLFLLVNGIIFYFRIDLFESDPLQITKVLASMFGWIPFWTLFLSPIITMRLFAEEKRAGTLETLLTAPVTSFEAVAGKFLAAQLFFLLIFATLVLHVLILVILGKPDLGPVLAVGIGLVGLGAALNALGILASAFTRNQIISVIIAFVSGLLLLSVGMLRRLFADEPQADSFFDFLSMITHFSNEYLRGVVDLRFLAFDGILTALFLFFAVRTLEARRWR
jgi:ABC-2 type transport system permease protein